MIKRNENDKNTNFMIKKQHKNAKKYMNTWYSIVYSELFQTLETQWKYNWSEIVSGTHSLPEKYL